MQEVLKQMDEWTFQITAKIQHNYATEKSIVLNKNSSGDEIANVNFLRRYGTYVLQNTKKTEPTSFNQLDDS